MKKTLCIIFVIFAVFYIAACGGETAEKVKTENIDNTADQDPEAGVPPSLVTRTTQVE